MSLIRLALPDPPRLRIERGEMMAIIVGRVTGLDMGKEEVIAAVTHAGRAV